MGTDTAEKRKFSLLSLPFPRATPPFPRERECSLADFEGLFAGTRSPLSYSAADARLTNCNEILYTGDGGGCVRRTTRRDGGGEQHERPESFKGSLSMKTDVI